MKEKQTACKMYGSMKDYCLKCKKFCVEINTDDDVEEDEEDKIHHCKIIGMCCPNADDNTEDLEVEHHEFALSYNFNIKHDYVELSYELLARLMFHTGLGYVTPIRKSPYYRDDDVIWTYSEVAKKNLENLLEAKKILFEKCDRYLRKTRCPLDNDDEHCTFFVERMMRKWNQK